MAAFARFALTAPALLACEKERAAGNVHTLYGIERVPCDTPMRDLLDPVSPTVLRPVFTSVVRQLQRGKALEPMAFLDGPSVLARDGTGYFSSTTIHCASCLHKVHRNGSITYAHQMLGAAIVHPEKREVIPLMPEPIVKQDGTDKNDGERHAAKRFLAKLRKDHPHLTCSITEDSLRANAPHIETLQAYGLHSILGGTEGAVRVKVIEYGERGQDKGQHCSWVTDLRVSQRHVSRLRRGGRARWQIANETCHTLQPTFKESG